MATIALPHHRARSTSLRAHMPGVAWWTVCLIVAALFLAPLVMVVLTALKTPAEAAASPPHFLPRHISLRNFSELGSTGAGILRYILNTAIVSLGTVAGTLVLTTLGATASRASASGGRACCSWSCSGR
jgi:multiple sugar transport system permease protein